MLWEAHAGIFPAPGPGWEAVRAYHDAGFAHVSLNVGFDLLDRDHALATARDWARRIEASNWAQMSGDLAGIRAARAAGRLSIAFDIEGAVALGGDAGMVEVFHGLGVRQMLLAYNRNTLAAGGCHDEDRGLTAFGRKVVAEMNRVGMIVDGSHAGERTVMDLLSASEAPVIVSHAGAKTLQPHGRNVSDAVIRAVAAQGGLIGVCGIGLFLGGAGAERMADHADHIAQVAGGAAHVALGIDWFPEGPLPGQDDVAATLAAHPEFWPLDQGYGAPIQVCGPAVVADLERELLHRGWTAADVALVFGGNMVALAERIWR
ncbi:MAG TPA: membrane dipeptidase [Tabrizicola sp.]|nr:membrane dipeptidase [Tabrizicola sp.]